MLRRSLPCPRFSTRLLAILIGLIWAAGVTAASLTDDLSGSPEVPWQISADNVSYDAAAATYRAEGNVVIEKQSTRLMADKVAFNHKAMTATAEGHVVMTVGDDLLAGDRVELDLDKETGVLHGGSLFLKANHFHIRGERIQKTGPDSYRAEKASVTTCDGDRPDWIITGRTVKVTIEGYGSATHAVFRARGAPLLYTPYLFFPAKTKRQTGLLLPEAGISDRKGFHWDQPLFWAIGDNTDATLYAHFMEERGVKVGLEYRYALTDSSFGAIMADGLEDRQIDDGSPDATADWGYAGDAYDRPNRDRYWLRAKLDQELTAGLMARLDLDIVSDQDYLIEFREGHSGFNATAEYCAKAFGRDLDPYDEKTRSNRLNINRNWSRFSFNGDLLWNDNVVKRRWEETDDTLQQLPLIKFDGAKQQAPGSRFFWNLDSEYTYFYREDGNRGHRADLYPRLYLPLQWSHYLSVEPSAGWRQTTWVMDHREDESLDRTTYRQIADAKLDISTEFSKIMASPVAAADRIRHLVKPRVVYEYIPDQDQSDLPDFDTELDRVEETNRITYSLTNTFTARKPTRTKDAAENTNKPESPAYAYDRICRFYLEQTYDIAAERDDDDQPFSEIFAELDLHLGSYFNIDADADYNAYDGRFSAHNIAAAIVDRRGDRLWVQHRYEKDATESIQAALSVKLTQRITARAEYERDLLAEKDILMGAGFLYTAQCWGLDLRYAIEDEEDRSISFNLNLMGIGGFGN
jgi:LPS-assembly protein